MQLHHRVAMLALALFLAGAWCSGADLASVVPEDALLYAEISDPRGIWSDFEQSGLRDIVRAVPQAEVQFGVATALLRTAARQRLGIVWDDFVAKFGSRFAIVLAEGGGAGRAPVILLDAGGTRAELAKLLKQTVEPALARPQGNQPAPALADEEHGGVALRVLRAPGGGVAYGFVGDAFLIGEPPAVKALIAARARRPLSTNQAFLKVRETLGVTKGVVAYLNFGQVLTENRAVVDGNPELRRLLDGLGLSTVQWVALASGFQGRGVRDKLYLHTGDRKLGLLRLVGQLSPGTSAAAQVLPRECPLLLSLKFNDGPELWKGFVDFLEEGGDAEGLARLDEGKQRIQWQFGINFDDDFVGALGGEIFVAANPDFAAEYAAKRRLPRHDEFAFILGARVAKPEALKTTIHRLVAGQPGVAPGVERKVELHRGVEINTLLMPDPANRPAYAFVGEFFIAAKNARLIRQCIDAKADGQNLAAAARFRNVADAMPLKHNALFYADIQTLATALVTGGRKPQPGAPQRPLVGLLAQIAGQLRGGCLALTADKQGVTIESYTRPGLLPLLAAVAAVAERRPAPVAGGVRPPPGPKGADF